MQSKPADDPQAPRHWLYLLAQADEQARLIHAARLTEKAWLGGHRVAIHCDDLTQAQAVDEILWRFRADSFLPHGIYPSADAPILDPIGIVLDAPDPDDWDTLLVLGQALPARASQFKRLALIASAEAQSTQQARAHYRSLQAQGVTATIVDMRKKPASAAEAAP